MAALHAAQPDSQAMEHSEDVLEQQIPVAVRAHDGAGDVTVNGAELLRVLEQFARDGALHEEDGVDLMRQGLRLVQDARQHVGAERVGHEANLGLDVAVGDHELAQDLLHDLARALAAGHEAAKGKVLKWAEHGLGNIGHGAEEAGRLDDGLVLQTVDLGVPVLVVIRIGVVPRVIREDLELVGKVLVIGVFILDGPLRCERGLGDVGLLAGGVRLGGGEQLRAREGVVSADELNGQGGPDEGDEDGLEVVALGHGGVVLHAAHEFGEGDGDGLVGRGVPAVSLGDDVGDVVGLDVLDDGVRHQGALVLQLLRLGQLDQEVRVLGGLLRVVGVLLEDLGKIDLGLGRRGRRGFGALFASHGDAGCGMRDVGCGMWDARCGRRRAE